MKTCRKCNKPQPIGNFWNDSYTKDGIKTRCKQCMSQEASAYRLTPKAKAREQAYLLKNKEKKAAYVSDYGRLRKTGCTPERYAALMYAQGGRCAVCMEPSYGKSLNADHDHDTKQLRGLLCMPCNQAEGLLKGNAWNLVRYLEQYT